MQSSNNSNSFSIFIANWNYFEKPITDVDLMIEFSHNLNENSNNTPKSVNLRRIAQFNANPLFSLHIIYTNQN